MIRNQQLRCSAVLIALTIVLAGCTVDGSAVIAPYRAPPVASLTVRAVLADHPGVLALAPDGAHVAIADPGHGVCLFAVPTGAGPTCADVAVTGTHSFSAAYAPDGRTVALGVDVKAQGRGSVYLVDVRTGRAARVPPITSSQASPTGSSAAPSSPTRVRPAGTVSSYVGMIWNQVDGHLLLLSNSLEPDGARERVVDLDPQSLIPRVVAQATSPYEFWSGYLAGGGDKVVFTVIRGDQIPPNLVVVDLGTGMRTEFDPLGADGTQIVPLAVAPNGRQAIAGSATLADPGPPRLLDLVSGKLTDIPGLTGDFVAATFSPDGADLAVVSMVGTQARIEIAPTSGAAPARVLTGSPSLLAAGSRLTWSRLDVVAIQSPVAVATGTVTGWSVSG